MTERKLPTAVNATLNRCAVGWRRAVTWGTGTIPVSYYGDPRGDGTRPTLYRDAPVESVCLRAVHPPSGRAVVAVWISRLDKDKRGWSLDLAWRGRHPGENTPRALTAGELAAYVSASTVDEYAAALVDLARKQAETTAKVRATRARKAAAAA